MSDKKENKSLALRVTEHGDISAQNMDELLQKAQVLMRTGFAPKSYKTPSELVGALLHCRQLGLPDTAVSKIYIVHGTPSAFGELPLAMAKRSRDFGEFVEFFIDKDGNKICSENKNIGAEVFGSVCRVKRKGCEEWSEHYFTREMAKKAGLIKNTWNSYFEDLLRYKSRSRALKANYANALHGLEQAEDLIADFESKSFVREAKAVDDLRRIGHAKEEAESGPQAISSDEAEELLDMRKSAE
jgi:hypothetical protein